MPDQTSLKFAAIDVGSNAVKLLLARVIENGATPLFKKESFIRMPIRLGEDVFTGGSISDDKGDQLIQTMIGFKSLIAAYESLDYLACATSAMREAANGQELAARIREGADIDLQIVDGGHEAEIIYANHAETLLADEQAFFYIDVGGGSTEISIIHDGKSVDSQSFSIGAIRLLKGQISDTDWHKMRTWLKARARQYSSIAAIGTGGNINKIFRIARRKEGKPMSYKRLKSMYKFLAGFTYEERIQILGLRPDRADVIIPACEIFLAAMKWSGIERMYVPQIGLSDGLVHMLYERRKSADNSGPRLEGSGSSTVGTREVR